MYSPFRDNFWNKIKMKNIEMNKTHSQEKSTRGDSLAEWDLSQIELRDDSRSMKNTNTIIDLEEEESDRNSAHEELPLSGFETSVLRPASLRMQPSTAHRPTSSILAPPVLLNNMARRPIHDYRAIFGGTPRLTQQQSDSPGATVPAGIIFNRSYNKKVAPTKENYFSVMDTPPTPGQMSAASIFGDRSYAGTQPKIVMTSNHYEKRIIRRSFDKTIATTPASTSRQEKNKGPYKLLGVIDLEPDSDSEDSSISHTVSAAANAIKDKQDSRRAATPVNVPPLQESAAAITPSSKTDNKCKEKDENVLTIEIEEDEEWIEEEDTGMELSEEPPTENKLVTSPNPGITKPSSSEENVNVEQCVLSDTEETSSATQMNPSTLANSFWDVSSSGCMKRSSEKDHSSKSSVQHTEFELLLDRINQEVPAMSQQDRIDHWRVTQDDLLYSIPTVAEIETGASIKRPMDDPIHISSGDSSSDSETSDSPSLLRLKQQKKTTFKRRRMGETALPGDRSSPSLHLGEELDFRRSQINPEIDKSLIQVRKNYYKFPTRFDRLTTNESSSLIEKQHEDPYAKFLDNEKEAFTNFLRRNPAYRPHLLTKQRFPSATLDENKVAVVMLSPITVQRQNDPTTENSRSQAERAESADRLPRYNKNHRSTSIGKTLRYKVRKPQLKKKPIVVLRSNLRSYRRLIMKNSLRNGKVRRKSSFVNLIASAKQKRRKQASAGQAKANEAIKLNQENSSNDPKVTASLSEETPKKEVSAKKSSAHKSSRVSIDSAVSSSTSAEHRRQREDGTCVEPAKVQTDLRTMKNPLSRANGEVLMVFFEANKLIVVQQELVSFWECSKLSALLGIKQELQLIGQIKRAQTDYQIEPSNSQRLGFNDDDPFYLELRARNLDEDESRICPLASIYVNHYFASETEDDKDPQPCVRMKSLQLDSIRSELSDIIFIPLHRSRYFVICWREQLSETDYRTGLCKYSLTPDLEMLASIREFPSITQKIHALKCMDNNRLLGLGGTMVAIWSCDNGCLMFTVDLKIEIQLPLAAFIHTENSERALFLIQLCASPSGNPKRKLIKIIAVNMSKRTWHQVFDYEVALESTSILCESFNPSATGLHCTTFQNGELLTISMEDLTTCFTNYKRLHSADERRVTRDILATREKIFLGSCDSRQLLLVSDKSIKLKTIDEYLLGCRYYIAR
ncbi:uncharacterized protein LOC129731181 [Wyeomyia smithii]|uniref:uncharacterized protein LOC129731181 n=1 Tax=Wyeomyia smithii TaxID=174621 RepID=UPI002467BA35|nr:uncharacterized protein LOC129731181 [Wyeomyia smithii]